MTFQDAADQLVTARARSIAGGRFAALAVDGALAALVAGQDGEALRELAGLSRSSRDQDVEGLLDGALRDIGIEAPMTSIDAQIVVLREMVSDALRGRISLRTVTSWAHDTIGHDGSPIAQPIVELDDHADAEGFTADADFRLILLGFLQSSAAVSERIRTVDSDSRNG